MSITSLINKIAKLEKSVRDGNLAIETLSHDAEYSEKAIKHLEEPGIAKRYLSKDAVLKLAFLYYLQFSNMQPILKKEKKELYLTIEFSAVADRNLATVNRYLWENYKFTIGCSKRGKAGRFTEVPHLDPKFDNSPEVGDDDYKNLDGRVGFSVFFAIADELKLFLTGSTDETSKSQTDISSRKLPADSDVWVLNDFIVDNFSEIITLNQLESFVESLPERTERAVAALGEFSEKMGGAVQRRTVESLKKTSEKYAKRRAEIGKELEKKKEELAKTKKEFEKAGIDRDLEKHASVLGKAISWIEKLIDAGEKVEEIPKELLKPSEENARKLGDLCDRLAKRLAQTEQKRNNIKVTERNRKTVEELFVQASELGFSKSWMEHLPTYKKVDTSDSASVEKLKQEFNENFKTIKDIRAEAEINYMIVKNYYKEKKKSFLVGILKKNQQKAKAIAKELEKETDIKKMEKLLEEIDTIQSHQTCMVYILKTSSTHYAILEKDEKRKDIAVLLYKKKPTFFELLEKYCSKPETTSMASQLVHYLYLLLVEHEKYFDDNEELAELVTKLKDADFNHVANSIDKKLNKEHVVDENKKNLIDLMDKLGVQGRNDARIMLKKLNAMIVHLGDSYEKGVENAWELINNHSIEILNKHKRGTAMITLTRIGINAPYRDYKDKDTLTRIDVSNGNERERLKNLLLLLHYYKKVYGDDW